MKRLALITGHSGDAEDSAGVVEDRDGADFGRR